MKNMSRIAIPSPYSRVIPHDVTGNGSPRRDAWQRPNQPPYFGHDQEDMTAPVADNSDLRLSSVSSDVLPNKLHEAQSGSGANERLGSLQRHSVASLVGELPTMPLESVSTTSLNTTQSQRDGVTGMLAE